MLKGKTIVITGASRGIGRAIARLCAREGAQVGINFLTNRSAAEALSEELKRSYGASSVLLPFDVREPASIANGCQPLVDRQTGIDGWVNNAGINLQGLLLSQTDEMIQDQVATNVLGPIHCSRFVLPSMMAARRGAMLNVGSIASSRVGPGQAVYAATKGALASFTRALAYEYGRKGIRVNCIEPGPVDTDMFRQTSAAARAELLEHVPLRRFGTPEDIAELAVFLLSDRAGFITGAVFTADGGYTLG